MKHTKKLAALLLALVLALSLGVTAFAEETGTCSITVSNAVAGETYSAYKIFDVTVDTEEVSEGEEDSATTKTNATSYAYTIQSGSKWFSTIQNFEVKYTANGAAEQTTVTYFTLSESAVDSTKYVVTVAEEAKSIPETVDVGKQLAEALNTALSQMTDKPTADKTATGASTTEGDTTTASAVISGLTPGYYFVDSSLGAVCALGTIAGVANDATIKEKNTLPSIEKKVQEDSTGIWGAEATLDVTDTVYYQLTILTNNMKTENTGNGTANYVIKDTLPAGIDYNTGTVVVTATTGTGDAASTETWGEQKQSVTEGKTNGTDYTVAYTDKVLTITLLDSGKLAQMENKDTITITYNAAITTGESGIKVSAGSKNQPNTNNVILEYKEQKPTASATVYTYTIGGTTDGKPVIQKVDGATLDADGKVTTTTVKLAGVKFILSKTVDENTKYATVDETGYLTGWVDSRDDTKDESGNVTTKGATRLVTGANGGLTVKGLDAGTYILTEVEALPGYNLMTDTITVKIAEDGKVTYQLTSEVGVEGKTADSTVTIINEKGSTAPLPATGGIGTTLFYIIGGVLVLGAAVLLITRRRMRADK